MACQHPTRLLGQEVRGAVVATNADARDDIQPLEQPVAGTSRREWSSMTTVEFITGILSTRSQNRSHKRDHTKTRSHRGA